MAEIMISKFKYTPPKEELTQEMVFKAVAEMKYRSPVEIVSQNIHENFENGVLEVIHSYDVKVDKGELIKALRYDREQYKQGYADGCRSSMNRKAEAARGIFEEIEKVIGEQYENYVFDNMEIEGVEQDAIIAFVDAMKIHFAELKKKYGIGGQSGTPVPTGDNEGGGSDGS